MPLIQPSRSDVHVDRPLTNVSLAFMQTEDAFVARKVFPVIGSPHKSNSYFTYERGDFNRDEMEVRAPGTESAGGTYGIGNTTFNCIPRAFHRDIPDQVDANADDPINLEMEASIYVTTKALIRQEVDWASTYFTEADPGVIWTFKADGNSTDSGGAFDPTDAGNNQLKFWSDGTGTPVEDVREGKRFVGESTGIRPNTLTVGRAVFDTLIDHPDIVGRLDRGQTTGTATVNRDSLAALFELDAIHVMDAIQNTAAKGATPVHSYIGGKHALLSYVPPSPGVMTPSAGYTFAWTGYTGATPNGTRIKRIPAPLIESMRIEIDAAWDQKLIAADLGYFFGSIIE